MTPAFPRRLTLGLLPTAILLCVALGFGGPSSSQSAPVSSSLPPLNLGRYFPELTTLRPVATSSPTDIVPSAAAKPPSPVTPAVAGPAEQSGAATSLQADRYLVHLPYGPMIRTVAHEHHLDGLLLASVVEAESSFRPDAVSPRGALGLMQLMPFHLAGIERPFDPKVNLELGANYLAGLKRRFGGDLTLALAAYHAGPTAVARCGRVPEDGSTPQYVARVLGLYREHQAQLAIGTEDVR
jgi:hypothetical protein